MPCTSQESCSPAILRRSLRVTVPDSQLARIHLLVEQIMFLLPRKRRAVLNGSSSHPQAYQLSQSPQQTRRIPLDHLTASSGQASSEILQTRGLLSAPVQQAPSAAIQVDSQPQRALLTLPSEAHNMAAPPRTWPCRECGMQLSSASNRSRHERTQHADKFPVVVQRPAVSDARVNGSGAGSKRSAAVAALDMESLGEQKEKEEEGKRPLESMAIRKKLDLLSAVEGGGSPSTTALSPRESDGAMKEAEFPASSSPTSLTDHATVIDMTDSELESMTQSSSSSRGSSGSGNVEDSKEETELLVCGDGAAVERDLPAGPELTTSASATAAADKPSSRPPMQDKQLQAICEPFLQWLCQPPITQVEALVKGRGRVKDANALRPVKLNLRFILALLLVDDKLDAEVPELQTLTRLSSCQTITAALQSRHVGSVRMHAILYVFHDKLN